MFAWSRDWSTLLTSIFKSVDFRNSNSWIVLDMELTDINVNKELEVFNNGKIQIYSFRPPEKYKRKKQAVWCTRNFHAIV